MKNQTKILLAVCGICSLFSPCFGAETPKQEVAQIQVCPPGRWQGPGFYFRIWFGSEPEYNDWCGRYYDDYIRVYPHYRGYDFHRYYRHGDGYHRHGGRGGRHGGGHRGGRHR